MWLITTDLHLTERPEHQYRIDFLDWLAKMANDVFAQRVFILGDLTDQKDRHSGFLVNTIVDKISYLAAGCPVEILFGNHDGPSLDRPYWQFLREIERVHYYTEAAEVTHNIGFGSPRVFVSPWGCENELFALRPMEGYVFMHATVDGAQVENGTTISGSIPNRFLPEGSKARVFSGDVHVPQKIGDVEYVGSPYHVHYGDRFEPRVLLLDLTNGRTRDLRFPGAPALHTLRISVDNHNLPDRIKLGDRVKLVVHSRDSLLPADWQAYVAEMRKKISDAGATLTSALLEREVDAERQRAPSMRRSDEAIVRTFASVQKYSDETTTVGVGLTKE